MWWTTFGGAVDIQSLIFLHLLYIYPIQISCIQFFAPFSNKFLENLSLNFLLARSSFLQSISSFIVAATLVSSSIFRIQRAEHLNAKHLSILLHLPLRVWHLKANVPSDSRTLSAMKCHPIQCSTFCSILFEIIQRIYNYDFVITRKPLFHYIWDF